MEADYHGLASRVAPYVELVCPTAADKTTDGKSSLLQSGRRAAALDAAPSDGKTNPGEETSARREKRVYDTVRYQSSAEDTPCVFTLPHCVVVDLMSFRTFCSDPPPSIGSGSGTRQALRAPEESRLVE